MTKEKLEKIILVGITGYTNKDWQSKIEAIDKLGLSRVTLFLERFKLKQRLAIYDALLRSSIKEIPMVHIRDDMSGEELEFLFNNFKTRCFTIHPYHFQVIKNWRGFYKYLYLEFGSLNKIDPMVKVEKIGGFCVDLSHFKFESVAGMLEADYINRHKKNSKLFTCNHLNGYDYKKNQDIHHLKSVTELNYLPEIPKFVFGKVIGLEMDNTITEQLKYKKYIISLLSDNK